MRESRWLWMSVSATAMGRMMAVRFWNPILIQCRRYGRIISSLLPEIMQFQQDILGRSWYQKRLWMQISVSVNMNGPWMFRYGSIMAMRQILKLSVLQEKAADKSKRFSARSVFVWKIQRFYCITVSLHPIRSIRKFILTLFHRDSIWRAVSGRSGFFRGGLSEGIFRCGFQRRGFWIKIRDFCVRIRIWQSLYREQPRRPLR